MQKINMAEMYHDKEITDSVLSVISSGKYIKGENNKKFEAEFSDFCNTKHSVVVNSGTNALILALKSLGIKKGDEVIIPSHTFIATANAVLFCGAKPVFADINKENYTINAEEIKSKITKKTKALIPVHIYGHPCDMDEIPNWQKRKISILLRMPVRHMELNIKEKLRVRLEILLHSASSHPKI